jgi:hypothetical protein
MPTEILANSATPRYDDAMLRSLGKSMQILALVLLPIAMYIQLTSQTRVPTGTSSVSLMLLLMILGICLFAVGRLLEGYGSPRAG